MARAEKINRNYPEMFHQNWDRVSTGAFSLFRRLKKQDKIRLDCPSTLDLIAHDLHLGKDRAGNAQWAIDQIESRRKKGTF